MVVVVWLCFLGAGLWWWRSYEQGPVALRVLRAVQGVGASWRWVSEPLAVEVVGEGEGVGDGSSGVGVGVLVVVACGLWAWEVGGVAEVVVGWRCVS